MPFDLNYVKGIFFINEKKLNIIFIKKSWAGRTTEAQLEYSN